MSLDLVSYLQDTKIQFSCKSNLTSAISNFSESQHLASYVSRHNAMAYDTVFPNNAAEQERYYLTNMLKKPQHISVHQFVQHVEQLNSYITQLPCWFYSPNVKPTMTPANVPFTKADLASHVLQICSVQPSQERCDSHVYVFASYVS